MGIEKKTSMGSFLLDGSVFHKRFHPCEHDFTYKQYYAMLPLERDTTKPCALFSINRFNLFSFRFKKHGFRNGSNLYEFAMKALQGSQGVDMKDLSWVNGIYILFQPALLGWSFNPVSFWFYLDDQGQIRAVLNEVNNTFGEHHNYLAHHDDFSIIQPDQELNAQKAFYVSPFLKVEGEYKFRFHMTPKCLAVSINYFVGAQKMMATSLTGKTVPLTSVNLLKFFFKIPIAHLKTVFLIHYQALLIWLKKIPYVPRKPHKNKKVTRCR